MSTSRSLLNAVAMAQLGCAVVVSVVGGPVGFVVLAGALVLAHLALLERAVAQLASARGGQVVVMAVATRAPVSLALVGALLLVTGPMPTILALASIPAGGALLTGRALLMARQVRALRFAVDLEGASC